MIQSLAEILLSGQQTKVQTTGAFGSGRKVLHFEVSSTPPKLTQNQACIPSQSLRSRVPQEPGYQPGVAAPWAVPPALLGVGGRSDPRDVTVPPQPRSPPYLEQLDVPSQPQAEDSWELWGPRVLGPHPR